MGEDRTLGNDDARAGWNAGADAYHELQDSGKDYYRFLVFGPALREACGDVQNLRVLDLGCGQGYFSRQMADAGAEVVGVDLSEGQLAYAQAEEKKRPLGIEYRLLDAADCAAHCPAASFDRIVSCFALQDMANLPGVLTAVHSLLKRGGRLIASVPHPSTDTPVRRWHTEADGSRSALMTDRYFETGTSMCQWNFPRLKYHWETPYWRRTLADWSETIDVAGLQVHRIHEPRPTQEQVQEHPNLEDCYRLPYVLIFDLGLKPNEFGA